jgi:hypothetical protein
MIPRGVLSTEKSSYKQQISSGFLVLIQSTASYGTSGYCTIAVMVLLSPGWTHIYGFYIVTPFISTFIWEKKGSEAF